MCIEVNALPGLTPTSLLPLAAAAAGLTYPDLIQTLVDVATAPNAQAVAARITGEG